MDHGARGQGRRAGGGYRREAHVELPVAGAVQRRYAEAGAAGLRDADIAAVAERIGRPVAAG